MFKGFISGSVICVLLFACNRQSQQSDGNVADEQTLKVSTSFKEVEDGFHFFVIGDWGRNGQYKQKELANMMDIAAQKVEPELIISTGDNFYPNGVASIDDPLWMSSYESIYDGHLLYCPWYVALGNHDYRGNAQAQIDYTHVSQRWNMPSRYYAINKEADDGAKISFVFIDTSPFELKYYQEEKYKYAVAKQDTARQMAWMDSVLANTEADWKIVIGHHPLYSGGKRLNETGDVRKQIEPMLQKHDVDLYLSGHEHDLQHIKPPGTVHHIISGAGSEVRPTGMLENSLFAKSVQGFVAVSATRESMQIQMVDYLGNLVYSEKIVRQR